MQNLQSDLNSILKNYFNNPTFKIISEHGGEINTILKINIEGNDYFLRPKSLDGKNDLKFEHELLEELEKHNLSVKIPKVLLTQDGNHYAEHDGKLYTLFTKIPGEVRFPNWHDSHMHSEDHEKELFKLLAELHNILRKINIPDYKNSQSEFELLERFKNNILNANTLPKGNYKQKVIDNSQILLNKIINIQFKLNEKDYHNHPKFITHYDFHYNNVLWDNNKIVSLLDFDWAQYSSFEYDFCTSLKCAGGLYSINGYSNKYLKQKLKLALKTYNKYADVPFEDPELLATLLDLGSLFLLNWSLEFYIKNPEKGDYYINFLQAGLDRIQQPNLADFFE